MKCPELWRPTKFISTPRGLRASRDRDRIAISSRFIADIQAQWYERALREHAMGRLIDLGCGDVPLYGVYRDLVTEVVCIDWTGSLHSQLHVDFEADISKGIPCEDSCADTVLVTDVLEHVPEPLTTLRESARVLRPNGKIIIGVPFFYWVHEGPHDYYRFTEFALRRLCQSSGFEIVSLDAYGGIPEILSDLTSKTFNYLPRPVRPLLRTAQPVFGLFKKMRFVRSLSERTKKVFPLGYVVVAQKRSLGSPQLA